MDQPLASHASSVIDIVMSPALKVIKPVRPVTATPLRKVAAASSSAVVRLTPREKVAADKVVADAAAKACMIHFKSIYDAILKPRDLQCVKFM